jgi:hypothetical protein
MLIDPEYRKCVTYLFMDLKDEGTGEIQRKPVGTAFFVCVPMLDGAAKAIYVATARHNIRKSRPYGKLYVRFNLSDGTHRDLQSEPDDWTEHPKTDVAAIGTLLPDKSDIKYIPVSMFENQQFVTANRIGEGDDVFFCGLFQSFPGIERMQPIIRFGNISLMPREKIYLRDSPEDTPYLAAAYLVEARSWGGHSGSPTFWYFKPDRVPGEIFIPNRKGGPLSALLGLVSSHYEIPREVDFTGDVGEGKVSINAGMAAVIPARFISELLFGDEFIEQRKKIEEKIKQNIQNKKELTQEDFEDVLRKIARPLDPDDKEERR